MYYTSAALKDYVGNYRISTNGIDTPLKKLTVVAGSFDMVYDGNLVLSGLKLNPDSGYISLHDTTSTNLDSSLVDYFEYGSSGNKYEQTAVARNFWDSGKYVIGAPPFTSSCREFNGYKCWTAVAPPIIIMRFAFVSPSQNRFCIKNAGVSNIDMQYAGICIGNTCLDSMTDPRLSIVKGNMNVLKNDSIVFQTVGMDLDTVKGSMALFAVNKFSKDTTNLLDYVSWGDSLQSYSGLAHIKGIWDSTTTVHLNTAKDSIVYTGDFTRLQSGAQWWQSRTPVYVPGVGISGGCFPGGEVSIYPNPASKSFSIRNEYGKGQATLLDVRGRLLKNIVLNQAEQTVGIDGLSQGIYMLQLTFDSGESRVVKLVVQE